jgi:O-antigen/teichoic acid export membrane protein
LSVSPTIDAAPARRRGGRAYFAASGISQFAALLRYVLLARLLGPEQLGLAATLILTGAFFDLISETAADRFLIQDRDGDRVEVQRLVQLVLALRGAGIAVAMAVFAWPIALFYKAPELAPALAILGISPLIGGFLHLDMRRVQRENDFRAESASSMASEIAGLIATVAAAYFLRNFTAVLYGLIAKSLVLVIFSHIFAKRRYGMAYSREHGPRLGRFSGPLVINGPILFLSGQGDRVVVGSRLGFAALGHYSAILLLIYYPASMVRKYIEAIYLPLIAARRMDVAERSAVAGTLGAQTVLIALAMSAGFALVAPPMVGILYGHRFTQAASIIALIGILQSSRFLIIWPTTVALAMARSGIVLASNILRLVAWPAAFLGVAITGDLYGLVLGFVFGELLAFIVALVMLNRSEKSRLLSDFGRVAIFLAGSACIFAWACLEQKPSISAFCGLAVVTAAIGTWIVRSERATITDAISLARRMVVRR